MRADFLPNNDAKFVAWFNNFNVVAGENAAELGLTTADMTALNTSLSNFNGLVGDDTAAKAASKGMTSDKKIGRGGSNTLIRKFARSIQADAAVSDNLRQALGLPIRKKPAGPVVPLTPASLVATPDATGVNMLKWKPGGNVSGTVYVVEAAIPGNSVWTQVGAATKTRFDHTGVTPGKPLVYRVWAQRGALQSAASNQAIVYGS